MTPWEDGGIGALIMAIIWIVVEWIRKPKSH